MANYNCYIGGELIEGNCGRLEVINPGTEEVAGSVSLMDTHQTLDALEAAQLGFEYWSSLSVDEREGWITKLQAAILAKRDEVLDLLMDETGKVLGSAEEDFDMLINCLTFYPEAARNITAETLNDDSHDNLMIRQPLGVVVAYLAWNFPMLNLGYKLGPVLASGCSCVIKPSELTPLSTMKIGEIMAEINFPPGVVNIVMGDVAKVAHELNVSPITQMITLIGSTATGKRIVHESSTSIKRFSLELGGNAPAIVLRDYDIQEAARRLTTFKFANTGQVCVSPNRIFVHEEDYESFVTEACRVAESLTIGSGRDPGAQFGPMISNSSRRRIYELIGDATVNGAEILSGGKVPKEHQKGYFIQPTILGDVTRDMLCYKEEIFGPLMGIIKYNDNSNLIELANDTEFGLTAYIFTNDQKEIERLTKGIRSGTVCVNKPHYTVALPHGGVGESGNGKDCSHYSLEEYYYIKRISIERV